MQPSPDPKLRKKTEHAHKLFTWNFTESVLANAMQLTRPPRDRAERIFRFSLYYFLFFGLLNFLRLTKYHQAFERFMGNLGQVLGVIFLASFVYMLNYMVSRLVVSRVIKTIWWALMGLLSLLIICALVVGHQQ